MDSNLTSDSVPEIEKARRPRAYDAELNPLADSSKVARLSASNKKCRPPGLIQRLHGKPHA